MPKLNFTVKSLEALKKPKEGRVEYWDSSMNGSFGLRVTSTEARTWVLMYRTGGRLRRFTIGKMRDISLAKARSTAKSLLQQVADGTDPATQKKEHRKAETFAELAHEYIERHAKPNKRSWKKDEKNLERDVLPKWGRRKAKDITRRDVLGLLDSVVQRGAPIQANRILALVRKVFNFGLSRDIIETSPCVAVQPPTNEKSRQGHRVLTFEEIRSVWAQVEKQKPLVAAIFKLRILTAQRGLEIRSMRWKDIDLETGWWTIPAEKSKNKLPHRVPLSPQAIQVIEQTRTFGKNSEFLFPSPKKPYQHMDHLHKAIDRIREASEVDFVERDLRRTVASHMTGRLLVPRLTVSKILNHVESGITKVYDRHSYDNEKRDALHSWGNLLSKILSGEKIENQVVSIHRDLEVAHG